MDMREQDFLPHLAQSQGGGGSPWAWVALAITLSAWVFMNIWSVNLVANGIESMRLYPPSFGPDLVMLFAFSLQCIVALLGLVTPLFFRRWTTALLWPFALVFCLALVGFEAYHAVFAQYKNSAGTHLLAAQRSELDSLQAKVSEVGAKVPAIYKGKLESFETLAQLSNDGKDESGLRGCFSICLKYRAQYAKAKARFSHLASSPVQPPAATGDDLRAGFTDLQGRVQSLDSAAQDLSAFFQALDSSNAPASVVQELASLQSRVDAMDRRMGDLAKVSAETLALRETNAAFDSLRQGQLPRVEARLPLVYGVLPALSVMVLTLFLRVQWSAMGFSGTGLGGLALDIARERAARPMFGKLLSLKQQNYQDSLRARFFTWGK